MFSVMTVENAEQPELNGIFLGADLSEEQAKVVFALGEQAVVFSLFAQIERFRFFL